ncbi:MAG: hypothetical protein ABI382_10780 [Nakamurella sp.]
MRAGPSRLWRALGRTAAAAALFVAAGCGQPGTVGSPAADTDAMSQTTSATVPTESSPAAESEPSVPDGNANEDASADSGYCADTAGWDTAEKSAELSLGGAITGLSGGSVGCFDSVNIRLSPSGTHPGYVVKYVDEVAQQGSGNPVPVAGGAALEVVLDSPTYDPATGEETFLMPDRENLLDVSTFFAIEQMAFGGSFEGMTTFAIGVSSELPFAVETSVASDDSRYLTISVAHAPSGGFAAEDGADNAGEYGQAAGCDDTANWDRSSESSDLSLGAEIIGISAGNTGCYEEISIIINPSDVSPGYDVKYVDVVTQDGSGLPVPVAGTAALQIVVDSPAYDPSTGEPTLPMADPEHVLDADGLSEIKQIAFAGSFEGMTRFAIGVSSELPFIVESRVGADKNHYVTIKIAHE